MILAQNHTQTLLLLVLSALCWGLWAAAYRRTKKWRYELFYFDVAIGAGIVAVVAALTLGSLGFDGFSFEDDMLHAFKHQWLLAFGAGVIFNLANMLMMGAIAVAGLSVAAPLALGISSMLGLGIAVLLRHAGNPALAFPGSACVLLGIVMVGVAYGWLISARLDKMLKEGKAASTNLPGYATGRIVSADAPSATKALLLSVVAAALMWIMYPLLARARLGDTGLGPYSLTFLFVGGMFFSTLIFSLFFLNLPIEGEPLEVQEYFQGGIGDHLLGLAAGGLLCIGLLAGLVGEAGPPVAQVGSVMTYGLKQGAILAAAVWGVWVSKDFRGAGARVHGLVAAFIGLIALGVVLLVLASVTAKA